MDIELGRGYVAFPRGLTDWEWYTEPNTARLYFHLLLTANWSRKQWQGITIQPGQLVTSRAHLAQQLGLTQNQVRTALNHLKTTGDITVKAGSKYSVITINHYMELTGLDRLEHRQSTGKPPADHQQITTTLPSIPSQPELPSSTSGMTTPSTHSAVFTEYEANIGKLAPRCKAELAGYAQSLGDEVVCAVLHKCGDLGGHSWAYVRKALEDARSLGCKTAQDYQRRAPIGGGRNTRVDRAEPSGNDWLKNAALGRPRRRLKKEPLPEPPA